ncbi:cytochrome b [Alphaproteobacteria bacterium GH1-50]|uniref:Cytochrome b n=1 Tax=Kangsaoukella pontilimi TaxID=2691042 RepID=A0A7C9IJ77_9RHOB|nr:cytochrome b [Kangsaoukella pontilimi]MXQ08702.1 cytochrome b [Kangsaoukella pontilimi]
MALKNGPESFGIATRSLHWLTVLAVVAAGGLGLWIEEMEVSLATLQYFGWHKTAGITVLGLTVLRIVWHRLSPVPPVLPAPPMAERLAKAVHLSLYACLLAMPLTGWIGSSATGLDTVVFGGITLPAIAPVSEAIEETAFEIHETLAALLWVLIALHVAGALNRAFLHRDATLRRMLRG